MPEGKQCTPVIHLETPVMKVGGEPILEDRGKAGEPTKPGGRGDKAAVRFNLSQKYREKRSLGGSDTQGVEDPEKKGGGREDAFSG